MPYNDWDLNMKEVRTRHDIVLLYSVCDGNNDGTYSGGNTVS